MTVQLGPLLRELRRAAELTQEQVSELSGVSVSTIRRMETGRSFDHRLGTLNQLADALKLSPEDRGRLVGTVAKSDTPAGPADAADPDPDPEPEAGDPDPLPDADATADVGVDPRRAPVPTPAPPPLPTPVAGAAEGLAREVRRRLQREEEQRRVHDPFALPVRWRPAPATLTDHTENIERLLAGGVSSGVDLSGDLRSIAEVYGRISSGRLVVLGRAGSGKSILTIRLALDLLAGRVVGDRVPVIFSIGSWDPTTTAFRDWMVDLLVRDHPQLGGRLPDGSSLAAALVHADAVLPVLDGFDEIAEGLRRRALEELNATLLPLVLTTRHEEFGEAAAAARSPLVWAAAVELTDLSLDDLVHYLPRTARQAAPGPGVWAGVLAELEAGRTEAAVSLARVLNTPLMVILARTMYSDSAAGDPAELLDRDRFPGEHALEEHLLAGFVPSLYRERVPERPTTRHRHDGVRRWAADRAQHWFGYLAHHLVSLEHDRQDLAWWQLGDSLRRPTRVLAVAIACAVANTLADWLVGAIASPGGAGEVLLDGAMIGPVTGLAFAAMYAVLISFGEETLRPSRVRLRLPGSRSAEVGSEVSGDRITRARVCAVLVGGFALGTGVATAITVERGVVWGLSVTNPAVLEGTAVNMLVYGLIFGLAAGLALFFMATLETPMDTASAATPTGLLAANRATVSRQVLVLVPFFTVAIAFGGSLIVWLFQGVLGPLSWRLGDGLFTGAIGGLIGALSYALGFTAWGQWIVLGRFWLPATGRLPWNTVAFLDDAYRRGVLRRSGAVYQFRHARLQHHLAGHYRRERPRR